VHKFLKSNHQHCKIADPQSLMSQKISVLNNVKYRFTMYNSHTEVNTVSLECFYCPPSPAAKSATPKLSGESMSCLRTDSVTTKLLFKSIHF